MGIDGIGSSGAQISRSWDVESFEPPKPRSPEPSTPAPTGFSPDSFFEAPRTGGIRAQAVIQDPPAPNSYKLPLEPFTEPPPPPEASQEVKDAYTARLDESIRQWQYYVRQFGDAKGVDVQKAKDNGYTVNTGRPGPADQSFDDKVNKLRYGGFPNREAEALRARGQYQGPFVAGRSTVRNNERTPAFFVNYNVPANSTDPKALSMQVYTFVREPDGVAGGTPLDPTDRKNWVTFEMFGPMLKAYNDPAYTDGKQGTNSLLGFPNSGNVGFGKQDKPAELVDEPFMKDPEVRELIAEHAREVRRTTPDASNATIIASLNLRYQGFQGGYMVDLGNGHVQAFKKDGSRLGTQWEDKSPQPGRMSANAVPQGPGSAGQPGSVYSPLEVAPGAKVNSRLGFSWPNTLNDGPANLEQAKSYVEKAKALGAGYTTLVLSPESAKTQAPLLKLLLDSGITPVVRLDPFKPADLWTKSGDPKKPGEIDRMAEAVKSLANVQGSKGDRVSFVQIGNEPNLIGESRLNDTGLRGTPKTVEAYVSDSTRKQAETLLELRKALDGVGNTSIKLGLPPVAAGSPDDAANSAPQTYYPALLDAIAATEKSSGKQIVDWIPTHNYENVDRESPLDKEGQFANRTPDRSKGEDSGARGQVGWGPATNHWYEELASKTLGRSIKALSTEGGSGPNGFRDSKEHVRREIAEGLQQLNGDPSLTMNLWLLQSPDPKDAQRMDDWQLFALDPRDPSSLGDGDPYKGKPADQLPERVWDAALNELRAARTAAN